MADSKIKSGYSSFTTTVPDQGSSGRFVDIHTRQIRDFQGRFAGPTGIAWQGLDTMSEHIVDYGERLQGAAFEGAEDIAREMVAWARENAPWEDDTGDARRELQASVVREGNRIVIWFGHGREIRYGVWLEIMQNGRFAIVLPTILRFAPALGAKVAAHV